MGLGYDSSADAKLSGHVKLVFLNGKISSLVGGTGK